VSTETELHNGQTRALSRTESLPRLKLTPIESLLKCWQ